ncbi:type II toxin-antitoxin system VapC family toxin [Sphingomonas aracearum]|uniref:Ribonuclease VapC n=1 Tax=Sphingomonas aracearum TaxID=2283317 RepID=A0A369VQH5_9SPHN|nr:type II toxin-antitoxin system VapC family toxin [Sphingomonas aracearum]RDE04263.1 type II toxin-antitoxin system VapC family toxin [Sphingomonas aracearum]
MLDTNIVSDMVRDPQGRVFRKVVELDGEALCVSIITAAELRYGCAKKGSPRLLAQVEAILEGLEVIPLEVPADTKYGGLRAELEAEGKTIGPNDLLIGAHALTVGATLVTANEGEFRRIRGLAVENWLA